MIKRMKGAKVINDGFGGRLGDSFSLSPTDVDEKDMHAVKRVGAYSESFALELLKFLHIKTAQVTALQLFQTAHCRHF